MMALYYRYVFRVVTYITNTYDYKNQDKLKRNLLRCLIFNISSKFWIISSVFQVSKLISCPCLSYFTLYFYSIVTS